MRASDISICALAVRQRRRAAGAGLQYNRSAWRGKAEIYRMTEASRVLTFAKGSFAAVNIGE